MENEEYDVDFQTIESHLSKFGGGKITLMKEHWDEGIAIIMINHLEKRNAISGKMILDLHNCLSELENWKEGKSVLLCGVGVNFCSGGDLDFAKATATPREGFYMSYMMQDILQRFRKLPLVSFSVVHGPTCGGGAELSIFTDYVIVTDNVQLAFVHGKMGIITAFGGTTRLVELLGERKALEMLLTSKIYNADECLDLGLAVKKISTANRSEEALNFVRQFSIHHSFITRRYKQIVSQMGKNFEDKLIVERRLFSPLWGAEFHLDAINKQLKHLNKQNTC